jgi:integrase/recombinase XerD
LRRGAAILRTFLSTGGRLSEVADLRHTPASPETNDVDLDAGIVRIKSGKGRRERISYLSAKAVKAIDRYLRVRQRHANAHLPYLWLGEKGRLTDSGVVQTLKRRGREVGVTGFHAHSARHWYAHEAMSAGPVEGEIMALAGSSSREMLSRYRKAAERERAVAPARRVNVGDRV